MIERFENILFGIFGALICIPLAIVLAILSWKLLAVVL